MRRILGSVSVLNLKPLPSDRVSGPVAPERLAPSPDDISVNRPGTEVCSVIESQIAVGVDSTLTKLCLSLGTERPDREMCEQPIVKHNSHAFKPDRTRVVLVRSDGDDHGFRLPVQERVLVAWHLVQVVVAG